MYAVSLTIQGTFPLKPLSPKLLIGSIIFGKCSGVEGAVSLDLHRPKEGLAGNDSASQ